MRIVLALLLTGCVGTIETDDPGGGPGGAPPDAPNPAAVRALYQKWSGCMTLTNFHAADMANAWGTLITASSKQCMACHDAGAYGFWASTEEAPFFDAITKHSGFMAMYFSADVAANKVVINTASFKGANSTTGHPSFDPLNNQGMTALTTFYNTTSAIAACDPPKLVD